ncbi:MAG TPA: acyl-CoA dehydratase activase [Spirochaetia bacterium]|nr:acyl-CoA dehydratase activase [Spirochaetia bacterium]
MITAGIDVGNKYAKVVLLDGDRVLARQSRPTGFEQKEAASSALVAALAEAGISREQVAGVVATGAGKSEVVFADDHITEVGADARGALFLVPAARTVVDVGAEEGRAIRLDGNGRVVDFAMNEKCAAGAGSFTESMARALEVDLIEMGPLSLKSTRLVPMNAQCAVFAESEVVSLIHARTSKEDIARAVNDAMASRIVSMTRRVGVEKEVVLIGGVAHNVGFVKGLEEGLELKVVIPEGPEYVTALGAACAAREKAGNGGKDNG